MRNVSIIVPTLNEHDRILDCLIRLDGMHPREIIVVDNGSTDDTADLVGRWIRSKTLLADLRLIQLPKPGKGAAVRAGMLEAKGDLLYMADCDLSAPASELYKFRMFMAIYKADLVIGSRRMKKSKVTQGVVRSVGSFMVHQLTHTLLPEIKDTQCGFKMFTREAARNIFSNLQLEGMAFDVEVLLEARRLGYKIVEMPVTWIKGEGSRVRVVRDFIRLAKDCHSLARRYKSKTFHAVAPAA
jgi:dolichyl-phosphate beta-glucosyltransferase